MAETFRVSSPVGMAGQGAQDTHCPPGRIPKTGASLGWRGGHFRPARGSSCLRKWGRESGHGGTGTGTGCSGPRSWLHQSPETVTLPVTM